MHYNLALRSHKIQGSGWYAGALYSTLQAEAYKRPRTGNGENSEDNDDSGEVSTLFSFQRAIQILQRLSKLKYCNS